MFGDFLFPLWEQLPAVCTVIVESGGYNQDPERQFVRKLNFVILLTAFEAIADKTYENQPIDDYFKIPLNEKMLNDLMIRRLKVKEKGRTYIMDFSFRKFKNC